MSARIDPVIPLECHHSSLSETLQTIRQIRSDYGIRRFLVIGPGISVRITGFPGFDAYEKVAGEILAIKKHFSKTDIEIGWWCAPTIKCGLGAPWQHIVNHDGTESPHGLCPLDSGMAEELAAKVALVAEKARPFMIQFEDDFELSNHPGVQFGCFCPLHLQQFNQRCGRNLTRQELSDLYRENKRDSLPLRREFAGLCRDSVSGLAARIRHAVDQVAPEIRLCQCEPGTTDSDGWLSEATARAFAGSGTRPAIRIYGTQYSSQDAGKTIPGTLSHAFYSAEHLPDDFELFHETDTYPHSRYFTSASLLESLLYGVFAAGADNTLLYALQYLDQPLEERGYLEMFRRNRKRFTAFQQAIADCELSGCQIVHSPEAGALLRLQPAGNGGVCLHAAASLLGCYGIPYTTRKRPLKILFGTVAEVLSETEINEILRAAVLLDAQAAQILSERGFGDLIGVRVAPLPKPVFSGELLLPAAGVERLAGRRIYNYSFAPAGAEAAGYRQLTLDGAEALSEYVDPTESIKAPGLARFENRLGGRVGVLGVQMFANRSSNMYCRRKKEAIRLLLNWLNGGLPLPAAVLDDPDVWLLFNISRDEQEAVLLLNNLNSDPLESAKIALAPEWQNAAVERLDAEGTWQAYAVRQEKKESVFPGPFRHLVTELFRFRKGNA